MKIGRTLYCIDNEYFLRIPFPAIKVKTKSLKTIDQNESKTIMNNERVVHGTGPSKNRNNAVEINMTGVGEEDTSYCGSFASCLIFTFSVILIVLTFPFSLCFCINFVQEYERAVIFRLGRVKSGGPVGPGIFFIVPCMDQIIVTDLRTVTFDVRPQEILTKDSVTISVDAVVYYR